MSSDTTSYTVAPPGFTPEQRKEFDENGFIAVENALSPEEVDYHVEAINNNVTNDPTVDPGRFVDKTNIVEYDQAFTHLIDHPRHIGFVYDLFGEQLKLQLSQFMQRPHNSSHNMWHVDGARALPYRVFSPELPLQVKIGYWLTDLPEANMGNLVVLPGSHREQYCDKYYTRDSIPGEKVLIARKGTMTIMHNSIWHRVEANESEVVRKNIFLAYCPSWITNADRILSDDNWLHTLTREQRIIMRNYKNAYDYAKPPACDFPLYLDRDTHSDRDSDIYKDNIPLEIRKRKVAHEK